MIYLDHSTTKETVPGFGSTTPTYILVGDAPSKRSPGRALEPFGPSSMTMLGQVLHRLNKSWDDFYLTNLVKVVPSKKVTTRLIKDWTDQLFQELTLFPDARVLALGTNSAKVLCPGFTEMSSDHGSVFWNPELSRYVVPTFTFKQVAKDPRLKAVTGRDLQRFFTWESGVDDDPTITPTNYLVDLPDVSGKQIILDIETTGLELTSTVTFIGLGYPGGQYHALVAPTPEQACQLGYTLHSAGKIIGHNLSFDLSILMAYSNDIQAWSFLPNTTPHIVDTMLLGHNRGAEYNLKLKHLMSLYTNLRGSHALGDVTNLDYLAQDLAGTEQVYDHFRGEWLTYSGKLMCDIVPLMARIRVQGVHFDRSLLVQLTEKAEQKALELNEQLLGLLGPEYVETNWNSPQQVATALMANGVKLTEKTESGNYSVAEAVLLAHSEHPLVNVLLELRTLSKLLSGFLQPYSHQDEDFVHPRLLLHGTATGRLSCREPNLQQIPRRGGFKSIFTPRWPNGKYGLVDLAQAELRVAALLTQDERFTEALLSEDVHRTIASIVFAKPPEEVSSTERKASKAVTFGLLYGGSPAGLAGRAGLPVKRIEEVVDRIFSEFPKLGSWLKMMEREAPRVLKVSSHFGRRRDLSYIFYSEGPRGVYRKAINTPIQSLASDIMLSVIRQVWTKLAERQMMSQILFGVHDSLLLEVYPGEEDILYEVVQEAFLSLWDTPLRELPGFSHLPIKGELVLADTWAECESTNEEYNPLSIRECSSLPLDGDGVPQLPPQVIEVEDDDDEWGDWD